MFMAETSLAARITWGNAAPDSGAASGRMVVLEERIANSE
jgi:hypothetical protein